MAWSYPSPADEMSSPIFRSPDMIETAGFALLLCCSLSAAFPSPVATTSKHRKLFSHLASCDYASNCFCVCIVT